MGPNGLDRKSTRSLREQLARTMDTKSMEESRRACLAIYEAELSACDGSERETDLAFFRHFGSSAEAHAIYDAVDHGFFYGKKLAIARRVPEAVASFYTANRAVFRIKKLVIFVLGTVLYYADIIKDILLAAQFKAKVLGQSAITLDTWANNAYPLAIFLIIVSSVVAVELVNAVVVVRHKFVTGLGLARRAMAGVLTPIMVGLAKFAEMELDVRLFDLRRRVGGGADDVSEINAIRHSLHALRAKMWCNENVVEHFVQLALLVTVFLAEESPTKTTQTVGNIITDANRDYVALAVALGLLSVVRGHVNYVSVLKEGHLPFATRFVSRLCQEADLCIISRTTFFFLFSRLIILPAYFLLGTAGRLFAIVLFCAPSLGLFSVLTLADTATMEASYETVYDFRSNGSAISLREAWSEFSVESVADLFPVPKVALILIPTILLVTHVTIGLCLRKFLYPEFDRWHVVFTLVCPPLFLDWEEIHRKCGVALADCWKKSVAGLLFYVSLHAVENAVLCVPLLLLRRQAGFRASKMAEASFALLPEEEASISRMDLLLGLGLVAFLLVLPALQLGLGIAYWWGGHPWSR